MNTWHKLQICVQAALARVAGDLFWYGLLAAILWFCFYVLLETRLQHRRVGSRRAADGQVRREILHSLRSIMIFGFVTGVVVFAWCSGKTQLYLNIEDYGILWLFVSFVLMIFMHDAYFYFTHRLMHHPVLFRRIHLTHHLSTSPTPWAAYAFSPVEALIQAGIGPLIVFVIPSHPIAFSAFMLWQITFNVFGHCGYEIFPRWFIRSPLGYVLNSVTHHGQHHEKFKANFGLYFNIWDRVLGSNHPEYEAKIQRNSQRRCEQS